MPYMKTSLDEIADGIFQISTYLPDAGEWGFTVNNFLIRADEPLLFHCGSKPLFENAAEFVGRVMKLSRIHWVAFSHVEADECGALEQWLRASRQAQVVMGEISALWTAPDLTEAPVKILRHGDLLDLGDKRVRYRATPHVLHGWDAGMLLEETTNTLLCADVLTQVGERPPVTNTADIVEWALTADDAMHATAITPQLCTTLLELAEIAPETLAVMHGASFNGDCRDALHALSEGYLHRLENQMP
jgi:flavorubredoxin